MIKCFSVVALWAAVIASAQTSHSPGAIDGKVLSSNDLNVPRDFAVRRFVQQHQREPQSPQDDQEIQASLSKLTCDKLRGAVDQAAKDRAKSELGIHATDAEIAAWRQKNAQGDPAAQLAKNRDMYQKLEAAYAAVYDQHRDPNEVFREMVQPLGFDQGLWAVLLHNGPANRQLNAQALQKLPPTPDAYAKAIAATDVRSIVENEKLNAVIDAQIAAQDSQFRAYLKEYPKGVPKEMPAASQGPVPAYQYIGQKRAEWWTAERSKLTVALSDPSLITSCGLPAVGVAAPQH